MRTALRLGSAACCVAGAIFGAFLGCGDTTFESNGADASSSDGHSDALPLYDSGSDATVGTTNCSSLTLCDTNAGACAGPQACVPPIPVGWSLVGFDKPTEIGGICGAKYSTALTFDLTDGGPAQCACSCTPGTPPSCTNLQAVFTTGSGCTASATNESISSACSSLPGAGFSPTNGGSIEIHLEAQPGSCTSMVSKAVSSWDAGASRECAFEGDGGEFCAGHSTCVAASGASHTSCIAQSYSGLVPPACVSDCPAGFTSSCSVVAGSAADTRGCAACTCSWNNLGCNAPTVTISNLGACGGTESFFAPDTCTTTSVATVGAVYATGSAATPTCGKSADTNPTGGFASTGEQILCCAN